MNKTCSAKLPILLIFAFTASVVLAETSPKCPGESGYYYTNDKSKRNPRKGGFVSESANVGDYIFIAPTAAVCGSASVLKFSRVYGDAVISGEAEVTEKARVFGKAVVSGTALIGGEAKVSDHAQVNGDAVVEGTAWLRGYFQASKGSFTKGVHKAKKSIATIAEEKRIADAKKAKAAQEKQRLLSEQQNQAKMKSEKCRRDFFAERERLERKEQEAANACNARDCKNYWDKSWGKRLKKNWDRAYERLNVHMKKRVYRECK